MTPSAAGLPGDVGLTERIADHATPEPIGWSRSSHDVTSSVVVCAYTLDRWAVLCEAIDAVERQAPHEIVVVIDHNDELAQRCRERWPHHVVTVNAGTRGLSGARNTGLRRSSGDVVVFLDDDAVPDDGWLSALLAPFTDPTVGLVGGRVVPRWVDRRPGWFPDEFLWVIGCSYRGLPERTAPIRNPIGASMAVRSSVFGVVGEFVDGVGRVGTHLLGCEETELSIRARNAGFDILYVPSAVVRHQATPDRGTLRYFMRRCFGEGLSKAMVTDLVGADDGLSSERAYTTRTLPSGVANGVAGAIRGPDRLAAAGRSLTIVAGLLVTVAGFVRGHIARLTGRAMTTGRPTQGRPAGDAGD